jgi:biopolymer transport protein ExbD
MKFERRFAGRRQLRRDLELTPMVDVVMQLIIFFMLSSTFVVYSGIRVDLPESQRSQAQKKQDLTITITADNTIYVNELHVPFEELPTVLANKAKELKEDQLVLIKCDRIVEYGRLIRVLDVAHGAGIARYGLMTRPSAPIPS